MNSGRCDLFIGCICNFTSRSRSSNAMATFICTACPVVVQEAARRGPRRW